MRTKLSAIKTELRERMHLPVPEQGEWLGRVVRGHLAYFAVPDNSQALRAFNREVTRHWRHTLQRRSQKGQVTRQRMRLLEHRWLPQPRILHPWPNVRFNAKTQGRSPVR
jgi:RNA-directed DNA polymerase